jgi:quercetin 2,3-dioxygenase
MKMVLHKSNERGGVDHGWLKAKHSFSFASWHDPEKIQFGALRVLNDDWIASGMGFGKHPHDNMEIITIPMSGSVVHEDSMGNHGEIKTGEIQVMSAGSGVTHSEFNGSKTSPLTLFQLWIFPKYKNIEPRYQQVSYEQKEGLTLLVGNEESSAPTWVHQDAFISMLNCNSVLYSYKLNLPKNGVYLMVIEGNANICGEQLNQRDAIGVTDFSAIDIETNVKTRILIIEVPMK